MNLIPDPVKRVLNISSYDAKHATPLSSPKNPHPLRFLRPYRLWPSSPRLPSHPLLPGGGFPAQLLCGSPPLAKSQGSFSSWTTKASPSESYPPLALTALLFSLVVAVSGGSSGGSSRGGGRN